jgi:asparagine synthetase B (glutamine-hydrolysing)
VTRLTELPPLADVLAYRDPEPERLDAAERALRDDGAETWRPRPEWVAAIRPLVGARGDDPSVRRAGLVFAEGRDCFTGDEALCRFAGDAAAAPSTLAQHPGDFTAVAFGEQCVAAVRSCGGRVPLWTWSDGSRAAVGTSLMNLLRALPSQPSFDLFVCAMWAGGQWSFPGGRSFFGGVRLVPIGHAALLGRTDGWSTHRYWDLRPDEPSAIRSSPEHAAELRRLLLGSLVHELPTDAPSLLALSGGVDSSALAALAGRALAREIVSFSSLPPDDDARARELGYIDEVTSFAGIRRRHMYVWGSDAHARLRRRRAPVPIPVVHPALVALPEVLDEDPPPVVYFGGEFADDLCGHWWRVHDWIDATSPAAFLAASLRRRLPLGRSDLLRWPKWRTLAALGRPRLPLRDALSDFIAAPFREEYEQWLAEERRALRADARPNRFLAAQIRLNSDVALASNWEVCSGYGIRRFWPFHTRAMLELAGRSDVREQLGPGTRRVLRQALAADVPGANLNRLDKGQWRGIRWVPTAAPESELDPELASVLKGNGTTDPVGRSLAHEALFDLGESRKVTARTGREVYGL